MTQRNLSHVSCSGWQCQAAALTVSVPRAGDQTVRLRVGQSSQGQLALCGDSKDTTVPPSSVPFLLRGFHAVFSVEIAHPTRYGQAAWSRIKHRLVVPSAIDTSSKDLQQLCDKHGGSACLRETSFSTVTSWQLYSSFWGQLLRVSWLAHSLARS